MNQPASLRSDRVAGIPWNGWPTCSGLSGRIRLDYVADFTGMRTERVFAQEKECIARGLGALANETWKHESAKASI